ncbi:MAG: hypothetical protein ACRC01_07390 [Deefgea sp.]
MKQSLQYIDIADAGNELAREILDEKKTDLKVGFLLQLDANYLASTAEATSEAASTTAEAAVSTAEAASVTAEAASTTAEAASAATSSFLPQADKATANKAASNRDFFILKAF